MNFHQVRIQMHGNAKTNSNMPSVRNMKKVKYHMVSKNQELFMNNKKLTDIKN